MLLGAAERLRRLKGRLLGVEVSVLMEVVERCDRFETRDIVELLKRSIMIRWLFWELRESVS